MDNQNVEKIKMVEKALSVLDTLRASRESLGVNEIAKKCDLTPSTAYRILKTMETSGWVFQGSDSRYIVGQKISFVTERSNLFLALKDVSIFTMNRFTAQYNQAMNLFVRDGINCYILQQSRTRNLVDYVPHPSSVLPFYACAGGKILLSELPIFIIESLLDSCDMIPFTPRTITDHDSFWRELRQVAKLGYAFDNRESSENGSCIAVPVRDNHGHIIAALSFSGFMGVEDPESLLTYHTPLKEAASEISHNLYRIWNC